MKTPGVQSPVAKLAAGWISQLRQSSPSQASGSLRKPLGKGDLGAGGKMLLAGTQPAVGWTPIPACGGGDLGKDRPRPGWSVGHTPADSAGTPARGGGRPAPGHPRPPAADPSPAGGPHPGSPVPQRATMSGGLVAGRLGPLVRRLRGRAPFPLNSLPPPAPPRVMKTLSLLPPFFLITRHSPS